tara:strand:+ start:446 stop:2218 length:1773 start_codon:yes stop_codon:yes gene_type:complete
MAKTGGFFSPNAKRDNRIGANTKKPLSPIGSDDYKKEVEGFIQDFKNDFIYRDKFDVDTGERKDKYGRPIPGQRFGEEEMRRDYPFRRQFRYENFDGEKYTPGVPFGQADTDTEVAGAFGYSDDEIERRKNLNEIINTPGYDPASVREAQRQLIRLNKGLSPFDKKVEAPKENILQKVGGFLANVFTGAQPVAAGTLDANQQVSQVSERPKLGYVNPDAKTMSLSEIGEAFRPRNLFGYKDKFGRFDDPGSPLARDRAETMQRVAQNFSSPITADARTIGQIKADQDARMRENARLRNESFQRGERVQQKSADVTYGTNMLSNPAFGFREKMTDAAKAQYDRSAKDATEMARTDPSLGNVAMQTFNRISGLVGGPQASLEKIGERQLRLANKEINRPTYQKEAYARKMLGITNEQLKARNLQRIRVNAAARNQAFQADRRAKAVERVARRYGQNTGSASKGFGSGTVGKGMSSNPASQRQQGVGVSANNLSRHSVGHSSTQPGSKKGGPKGGGGNKGGGGGGTGGGGGGGTGGGGQSGGSPSGKKGINRSKSRRRCDIRTKIDITSLTNQNLIKDDLATVAYFVQELRGE